MELINFKEILSIETFDKKRNLYYIWRKGVIKKHWLWGDLGVQEGFWKISSYTDYTTGVGIDLLTSNATTVNLNKYIIENIIEDEIVYKVVYDKPYCKIIMKNKCTTTKLFDTYKEAKQYAEQIRNKCSDYIKLIKL